MTVRKDPFEQILRPLYEGRAVLGWAAAGIWCLGWALALSFATGTILLLVAMCALLAGWRFSAAYKLAVKKLSLIGKPVEVMADRSLMLALPKLQSNLWLGWGFRWEPSHTQRAHEVLKRDMVEIYPPEWALRFMGVKRNPAQERGLQWIHGLEPKERDVLIPFDSLKGHCAVIATTRAIKTKLVSLVVPQLVARGDAVIILDPKGDKELEQIARHACTMVGEPGRFLKMHPAFASESVRMDLLKNWDRVSQVASRISLVLGSQEESTFKEFCWSAVHSITSGMKFVGRRVSIAGLKTYMQSRVSVEKLTEEALAKFFQEQGQSLADAVSQEIQKLKATSRNPKARTVETGSIELMAMMAVFNKDLAEDVAEARRRQVPAKPDEIRGLISILEANKEWFSKMIVSITPMLTKLSTDDLKGLLSPDYEDPNDNRPIMDTMRVVRGRHVLYVGSDTLADPSVGHALNAMIMADAAAVAAELYNYGIDGEGSREKRAIHVIADEWGDAMCEPLVQLANKGAGAGIFIWALGQTLSDLTVAFGGDRAKALKFMGNMNNLIVGATQDPETVQLVSEKFGLTTINSRAQSQSTGSKTEDYGLEFSVNRGESIKEMQTELFPPSLLSSMPDLQYIAVFNRSERVKGRIPVLQFQHEHAR